ncbi:MAG: hypothetical protein ABIH59_00435 [archaeon]
MNKTFAGLIWVIIAILWFLPLINVDLGSIGSWLVMLGALIYGILWFMEK